MHLDKTGARLIKDKSHVNTFANMDPLPGDFFVVAYKAPGLAAKAIGLVTHSRWTHAAIVMPDGRIAEAAPNGFRIVDHNPYLDNATIGWSHQNLGDDMRNKIINNAQLLADLNIGYGWADILAIGAAAMGIKSSAAINRLHRPDKMICSAAVAHLNRWAGNPLTASDHDDDLVTPYGLAKIIGM